LNTYLVLTNGRHTIAERLMRLANGTLPWPWAIAECVLITG